jgi:tetratricopeptide (TPR) repeat protein
MGEREEALRLYREELQEAKELPFLNEVAWCLERAGQKEEAIDLYQEISKSSDLPGLTEHASRRVDRLVHEQDLPPPPTRQVAWTYGDW